MEKATTEKFTQLTKPAEIQLTYVNPITKENKYKVSQSSDAAELANYLIPEDKIELHMYVYAIIMDRANNVLGYLKLTEGNTFQSAVNARAMLAAASLSNACNVILFCNHPSGNTKPSKTEIRTLANVYQALHTMDFKLYDFLIVHKESYFSSADEGLIAQIELDCKSTEPELTRSFIYTK